MRDLLQLSALALARRMRRKEASSSEVVECHIERIEQVNGRINAVVRDRFEEARLEAKRADARLHDEPPEDLPPLLGVPCTVKESIALEGMPNSSGMLRHTSTRVQEDATAVARLRAAGAIPLGVTNVSELTVWTATFNKAYGRTRNPYDVRRIAGGSSGGEGAIVGAGGSPFGLGTDVGGSIRVPAFCNGVFGHKPTGGLVPGTGQFPQYRGAMLRVNTTGPLARRAEDLMPLLRILAGPDGRDEGCLEQLELGDPEAVDLANLRVVVVEDDGARPRVARDLHEAQQRAAYALAQRGAHVDTLSLRALRRSLGIYLGMVTEAGGTSLEEALGDGGRTRLTREWLRWATRRSPHTYPPLLVLSLERLAPFSSPWLRRRAREGRALDRDLHALLGHDGVLLYPSAVDVAPRHGPGAQLHFRFSGLFNVLEMPVTQVPLGLSSEGMPLGVQVAAARGKDHLAIAAALALERALGGWVAPA